MTTKENTRHIQSKAIRERLLFKRYLRSNSINFGVKFTPYNGKDQHDVTYHQYVEGIGVESVLAEIKVREMSMTSISGGYYIEQPKYDYLMSQANKYDRVEYINIFEDGILIWDLKKLPAPTFNLDKLPENNHSNNDKIKDVGYLYFWDCSMVKRIEIKIYETLLKCYQIHDRINK